MTTEPCIVNVSEYAFFDAPGGAARLATDLALEQAKWGYRSFLVSRRPSADYAAREHRNGVDVLRVSQSRHSSPDLRNLYHNVNSVREAVRSLVASNPGPHTLHFHSHIQGLGAMWAVRGQRIRRILTVHSPLVQEMVAGARWGPKQGAFHRLVTKWSFLTAKRLEATAYRLADIVTCDSQFTRKEICRDYPAALAGKSVKVLPGWADAEQFTPHGPVTDWQPELGRRPAGPVFFSVRGLHPRNGLEVLVDAASLLEARGLRFEVVIVGSGPLESSLRQRIARRKLGGCVTLIGRVAEDVLPKLYRSCDAFVLPTQALECFGIIIIEALASGKPVIATPVGAIPELLTPIYPEGLLPDCTAEGLAVRMGEFMDLSRSRHPQEFRAHALQHYTVERGTERFRRLYEGSQGLAGTG